MKVILDLPEREFRRYSQYYLPYVVGGDLHSMAKELKRINTATKVDTLFGGGDNKTGKEVPDSQIAPEPIEEKEG